MCIRDSSLAAYSIDRDEVLELMRTDHAGFQIYDVDGDGQKAVSYTHLSVTVIGGGVIGVEFAYLLNRLGSKVTVLELMDHILPMVDIEVSRLAEKRMTKDGILFRLGAKVSRVKDDTVYYEFGGQNCQVKSDMVLMACLLYTSR